MHKYLTDNDTSLPSVKKINEHTFYSFEGKNGKINLLFHKEILDKNKLYEEIAEILVGSKIK